MDHLRRRSGKVLYPKDTGIASAGIGDAAGCPEAAIVLAPGGGIIRYF
jgi:hypothetical protein